ncbi:YjcG family protein [Cytobacillus sp. Hm23]
MKYGIVLFPSKQLQDKANSYRKRYDPNYSLIPPHITLKASFESDDNDMKEMVEQLKDITEKVQPFNLHVYKFSSFSPVNNVIYLKVNPTPELLNLHEMLHSGLFADEPEYAFVPHITIGQKLSNDEHSDVFGRLKMTNVNFEEKIDRFHLLYQLDNGQWTVYETFQFGKDC